MTYRSCVSILLTRPDGTLLIVHKPRERDAWQLPQGGIEEGETPEIAAARELKEETGVIVCPGSLARCNQIYQYDFPDDFIRRENPEYGGQCLEFVKAKIPQNTKIIVDMRELDKFKWIKEGSLEDYFDREEYVNVVRKVIKN